MTLKKNTFIMFQDYHTLSPNVNKNLFNLAQGWKSTLTFDNSIFIKTGEAWT